MTFEEILAQAIAILQRRGRVTYNALKLQFKLDEDQLAVLKDELLYTHPQAVDDAGRGLRWTGGTAATHAQAPPSPQQAPQPVSQDEHTPRVAVRGPEPRPSEAERRQLTVLFCDLVDSTALAGRLDPEDLREVVRAYQEACAKVITRFEGYIAQYLGDGLLVYFGYPLAHEDEAQRAIRAGLGMVEAIATLNTHLEQDKGVRLAVRVGIHTGLVVVGKMGAGARQEPLALGETPILAARLQNLAAPQTVVISAATYQLVEGWFTYQALGAHALKGFPESVPVYRILSESGAQNRLGMTRPTGLMPLVGREQELGLLLEWWAQVQEGMGQVVVLSGEAGIGKSRLVQEVQTHAAGESHTLLECRCSPYTQNSPLSSVIELFQRMLRFARDESPQEKLGKLEGFLAPYPVVLSEIVPLLAPLLSLPAPERYSPFTLTPQRQRQRTLEAVLAVLLALAAQRPPLLIMEDVHWADPSTLDLDLDPEGAEAVVKALEAEGQDALAVLADVSQPEATERMAQAATARFGRIDGLINNAALFQRPAMSRVPFDRIPVPEWDRLMAVNLRGVFLCCRAVVPYMRQQRSGQIVNISSGTVFHGSPLAAHYVASKAGVIGLTRSLARELGEDNITVNAIAPGLTISMDEVSDARMTQNQQRIQARALKHTETPQDLVGTVVFLCSSESDFMTGQTLVVDGGAQMH